MLGFPNLLFSIVPLIVFGGFAYVLGSIIYRWAVNQASPVNEVCARVIGKRQHFSGGGANHVHHHTSYHVTFELEDGARVELPGGGSDYGILVEGDRGILNFQGTQLNSFQRDGLVH